VGHLSKINLHLCWWCFIHCS